MNRLTNEIASNFAKLTLGHLDRPYPYKPDHVLAGPEDVVPPAIAHPIFHGSFDWHSCVHGWWQVLRLARLHPDIAEAGLIRARATAMLTPENVSGERAYFAKPMSGGFSRPYGWAWLLALHGELARHNAPWATALEPLARDIATGFKSYFPKLTYPIRVGTHFNSSFASTLALEWAREHDVELASLVENRAVEWFAGDRGCQAWEPGGDEFLSSALTEAQLMGYVLGQDDFVDWFEAFLPAIIDHEPATLFKPAFVSDRSDGKIAHLDGLNLSRAWCWRRIGASLGVDHPVVAIAEATAQRHLDASLPHVAGDYMGEHWLATFAVLALSA
jgi:hypothetical protein